MEQGSRDEDDRLGTDADARFEISLEQMKLRKSQFKTFSEFCFIQCGLCLSAYSFSISHKTNFNISSMGTVSHSSIRTGLSQGLSGTPIRGLKVTVRLSAEPFKDRIKLTLGKRTSLFSLC